MKVGFISLGSAKNQVNCEQMIWKTYEAGYEVALGAADAELLRRNKARLKFSRKVSAALVEEAADALAQAKAQGKLQ